MSLISKVYDKVTANTVSTGEADITNETLVVADMGGGTPNQSISANTWTTLELDNTTKDERGEWDTTNYQFSPDKSGYYHVTAQIKFQVNSDGDKIKARFQNVTDGNHVIRNAQNSGSARTQHVAIDKILYLESGKNYEVQGKNVDSSDTMGSSAESGVYCCIRSVFR